MPTVTMLSAAELVERRRVLLDNAGMSEDELRERAADFLLPPDLAAAVREIEEIDFLLGG